MATGLWQRRYLGPCASPRRHSQQPAGFRVVAEEPVYLIFSLWLEPPSLAAHVRSLHWPAKRWSAVRQSAPGGRSNPSNTEISTLPHITATVKLIGIPPPFPTVIMVPEAVLVGGCRRSDTPISAIFSRRWPDEERRRTQGDTGLYRRVVEEGENYPARDPRKQLVPGARLAARYGNRYTPIYSQQRWTIGAAVTERFDCSPPIKAKRVRSLARSLSDFRKWESCRTMPLVGRVFSGISRFLRPCIPALLHAHFAPPPSALNTSMLRTAQISPLRSILDVQDIYGCHCSQGISGRCFERFHCEKSDLLSLCTSCL
ncbi:hypothetical protein PR048_002672 [Dryococelus australis]|uniref:Uncharacterized protein n=1 Tax=Dryococelus australis TaxID=614101 RepID=A0ABQ9IKY9_9NEOP|nr:hypothetical protein PR048_002672 [Dryococelus australis]